MKQIVLTFCTFILSVSAAFAQQKADVETWRKEYEERFNNIVKQRREQKPNFAADVKFSKPDYIVFVPNVEPEDIGDTYNDHFQVFDKPDGTLFAVWCQATCEGALDQHVAFSRSRDKGKTWDKPKVLAGNRTVADGMANGGRIASWASPMVSKSGRIYMLYNQFVPGKVSTNRQHTGVMMGIYSDDDGDTWTEPVLISMPRTTNDSPNPDIPAEWCIWQRPLRQGKSGSYLVGVSRYASPEFHSKYRTVTEFIHFDNIDADPEIKDLAVRWVMTDDKVLHKGVHCEEPAIVMLPDGRLFCVMRSGIGSPCWTVSSDHGETWTEPKALLMKDGGDPISHPMSPCPIYDWKGNEAASGLYFFLAHNNFQKWNRNPWQNRGPLFLFAGRFKEGAEQPVWFDGPKRFIERKSGNSFYTSTTIVDGRTVLWYPDQKFYLLGRIIDESFFDGKADAELYIPKDFDLSGLNLQDHADGKPFRKGKTSKLKLKNSDEEAVFKSGVKVFSNRNYQVIQCPEILQNKKFVRGKIEGVEVTVLEDGMLYALTPMKDRNRDCQIEALTAMGFEKVSQPETLLYERIPDAVVTLFQKEVKAGETIKLQKWGVLLY